MAQARSELRQRRAAELDEVYTALAAGVWHGGRFRSPTSWLVCETGESWGQCALTIRLAERVQSMPLVHDCFATGALSETALRLLCDTWTVACADAFSRDEALLLSWAQRLDPKDLQLVLTTWRAHADPEDDGPTPSAHDRRSLHISDTLDGMVHLDATLDREAGAIVRQAFREHLDGAARAGTDARTPAQRRADALVAVAQASLGVDDVGSGRRRNKVIVTVAWNDLTTNTGGGLVTTPDGSFPVPSDTIRRLCCDAGIHRLVWAPDGSTLDYGRAARTVTPTQYDRIVTRDHGCRCCGAPPSQCEVHHVTHWVDGGTTADDELVMLCWNDHHLVHEQHWILRPHGAGHFTLTDPYGATHPIRPPHVGTTLFDHAARPAATA